MKVTVLQDSQYSPKGWDRKVLKKGDVVDDLPSNILEAWLKSGAIEEYKEPKISPKKATANKKADPKIEKKGK